MTYLVILLAVLSLSDDFFLNKKFSTGQVPISGTDKTMFYWLIPNEAGDLNAPLFLWLQGGPACNSDYLALDELGPFKLNSDGTLKDNPNSWTKVVDVVFVDNPIGTGWSQCNDITRLPFTEEQISEDLYTFLLGFLNKNPQYKKKAFYLSSQSYGGHYVPNFAAYILNKKNSDINLKGITLGNALISPATQLPYSAEFAYQEKLLSWANYEIAKGGYINCVLSINSMLYTAASSYCGGTFIYIAGTPYKFNIMDIRKPCVDYPNCYDYSNFKNFLTKDAALIGLNVKGLKYESCNQLTQQKLLSMDYFMDYSRGLETALAFNVPVYLYNGNKDFICPYMGGQKVSENLNWKGKDAFGKEKMKNYTMNGVKVGEYKQYGLLYYATVYDAGHRVPYDQPEWTLDFLKNVVLAKTAVKNEA